MDNDRNNRDNVPSNTDGFGKKEENEDLQGANLNDDSSKTGADVPADSHVPNQDNKELLTVNPHDDGNTFPKLPPVDNGGGKEKGELHSVNPHDDGNTGAKVPSDGNSLDKQKGDLHEDEADSEAFLHHISLLADQIAAYDRDTKCREVYRELIGAIAEYLDDLDFEQDILPVLEKSRLSAPRISEITTMVKFAPREKLHAYTEGEIGRLRLLQLARSNKHKSESMNATEDAVHGAAVALGTAEAAGVVLDGLMLVVNGRRYRLVLDVEIAA